MRPKECVLRVVHEARCVSPPPRRPVYQMKIVCGKPSVLWFRNIVVFCVNSHFWSDFMLLSVKNWR